MNRATLQILAAERAADALALQHAQRWSACYYLAGYAVECALKACIARRTRDGDFPDKKLALESYTHDLRALLVVAGLRDLVDNETDAGTPLGKSWSAVKKWSEQARYQIWDEQSARDLLTAVTDAKDGVLPWIELFW